jgi:hypothetical protein
MAKDVMGRFCEYVYANVETLTHNAGNLYQFCKIPQEDVY